MLADLGRTPPALALKIRETFGGHASFTRDPNVIATLKTSRNRAHRGSVSALGRTRQRLALVAEYDRQNARRLGRATVAGGAVFGARRLIKHLARGQDLRRLIVNRKTVTAFQHLTHDKPGIRMKVRGRLGARRHGDLHHFEPPVIGHQLR